MCCTVSAVVGRCEDGRTCKPVVGLANTTLALNCTLGSEVKWLKGTVELKTDDKKKVKVNKELLEIVPSEEYSGEFQCAAINSNDTEIYYVYVAPYVKKFEKPKNVIEGDPFQLECVAWGLPAVTVTWSQGETPIEADGVRVVLKNSTYAENATLRVEKAEFTDEAIYTCFVINEYGNMSTSIQIRVKDKLAALWPFLGICAEVIILCAIIFIYEKRRNNKNLDDDEPHAEETEHMNADGKAGNDDVRQRK
jgi:hypothetical protein